MKQKIVSIDFDGVVIEKTFYKDLVSQAKSDDYKRPGNKLIYLGDWMWTWLNQMWRKPVVGSKKGIVRLRELGFQIVMLTSRKSYLRKMTISWVKKWGYFELYDKFYFNNTFIGAADSKVRNVGIVGSDIHIDDNWDTIVRLAKSFPEMKLWYLGENKKNRLENIKQFKSWGEMIKKI